MFTINCTLVNNRAMDGGDQGRAVSISSPTKYSGETDSNTKRKIGLSNSILWGIRSPADSLILQQPEAGRVELQNCCIQGWSNELGGQGNFGDDPLFANLAGPDQIPGTADDDVSLSPNSPCIDRGDSARIGTDRWDVDSDQDINEPLPFDINQQPRIWGGTVDVGASEFRSANPEVF